MNALDEGNLLFHGFFDNHELSYFSKQITKFQLVDRIALIVITFAPPKLICNSSHEQKRMKNNVHTFHMALFSE